MGRINKKHFPYLFDFIKGVKYVPINEDYVIIRQHNKFIDLTERAKSRGFEVEYTLATKSFVSQIRIKERSLAYRQVYNDIGEGVHHVLLSYCNVKAHIVLMLTNNNILMMSYEKRGFNGAFSHDVGKNEFYYEGIFDDLNRDYNWALAILWYKRNCQIKHKKIKPRQKVKLYNCKYLNESPVDFDLCDINWNNISDSNNPFYVRPHLRMQRVGKNREQVRLTKVKGHMKKGYTKGPYKNK